MDRDKPYNFSIPHFIEIYDLVYVQERKNVEILATSLYLRKGSGIMGHTIKRRLL